MSASPLAAARRAVFDGLASRWDEMRPADKQHDTVQRGLALLGTLAGCTVADVGCGTGLLEGQLLRRIEGGRIVAIDSSPEMLAQARSKHGETHIEWLCRDVLEARLGCASVDAVLCYNTWPHFDDPPAVAREIARWLKPGGRVLVWHDIGRARLAEIHAGAAGPISADRLPPVRELAAVFSTAGFDVQRAEEDDSSYTLLARRAGDTT
jgi:ubiquinone/menaquinone biosynthesis C-methylase UbiE